MAGHRLFVALRPPPLIRATLADAMEAVPGARWQDDDQLHCTIRFVGEVDRHVANDVAAALDTVRHPPVEAALGTLGTFDRGGSIHSLWVAITPVSAVSGLHAKVERRLIQAGIAPEHRAFLPHVTLARFSRRDAPPADLAARLPPLPASTMRFDEFVLYESQLGKNGAVYDPVVRFALR